MSVPRRNKWPDLSALVEVSLDSATSYAMCLAGHVYNVSSHEDPAACICGSPADFVSYVDGSRRFMRDVVAYRIGQQIDRASRIVAREFPYLSVFACAGFAETSADDGSGHEFFVCPPQSLFVFMNNPDGLAQFNNRGSDLESAGLVEAIPGSDPVRHRLTARGKELIK